MIKGLSKNIVNFLLSSFFENIEEKQLQTSLIRGKVHLQNVKIKKKFFDILYLPYTIKYGYIRSLDLQVFIKIDKMETKPCGVCICMHLLTSIPLLYLFQKATITIKDVIIVIKEKNFNDFNIVEEINGIKIAKKNNLKIEENNSIGANLNQKINKGINSLLYELYNNISIDIENVEIILEGSEKKKNILGLFIKRITSFKNHNHTFKIYKDFSFTDIIFYMEDEKSKYLINKIIKKEEKRKKNKKKNRNVDEIYNKIKDITNNLHKKKYIISEIPIIVLSTILSIEKSSQYIHHNSKYIFKKKNSFDLVCSHCDKYLYQCKEIKKEKGIFDKFLNQNIHFNDDSNNNKLNNEGCAICVNGKKNDLEKSKNDEFAKELMGPNTNNNVPTKKDENKIDNNKNKIDNSKNKIDNNKNKIDNNKNNNICESCKKKMNSDKNLHGNETNLHFNAKENKLSNIDKFNIKASNNSINNKTSITKKNDGNNNMKNDTFSSKNSASNLDVSNELDSNDKYPLLSLFKTNSIGNVNRKGKKRESFNKKGRRKSINYLFNPDVCNSISQGMINRNDTITNVSNSSNEMGLDKDGGGSTSIIDSKSEKSVYSKNNVKNKQDKNKEIEKNKLNDNKLEDNKLEDNKLEDNKLEDNKSKGDKLNDNKLNDNKSKGKKYCRELYISSEKDFADININFMNNVYINLIINKKYSLLASIQNISLNSFFFTKTNIQAYLENLTMINDNNNKFENENQENASGLDASNSIIMGSTGNNNMLSGSNDSIVNGSSSETSHIKNHNELINNINDDKKSVTKVINENESKLLLNNSYSNIYYNDSKRENTSVSNSYYHKMLSSDNDICDDNQKIKMEYKKYYQDFLRVNDLTNIEKSKIFEHKYNRNRIKNNELNNMGSSNEIKNTYITTSNNIEKNKYGYLSSSSYKSKIYSINYNDSNYISNSNSSHINGYMYDYDSEEIHKKKKDRCKKKKRKEYINNESDSTNSYNYQNKKKKKKKNIVNKENNIDSDDNTSETRSEKETMLTAIQQKRSCFNLSIFFMKNKSNEKIQKMLLEENSKNKKYILKPLKISLDTIIYNFKDGNEKKLTFIHTNYKQYLYFNFDDKHIFKLIFFYYHYKFYVDKIYEQLCNRNNSDNLNLNTIDFRSYKTLQILLDNGLISNKNENENKFVYENENKFVYENENKFVYKNEENRITEIDDSNIIDKEIETNESSKVCENKNEEDNNINQIYVSTIENPDNIEENSNNNIKLNINNSNIENTDIIDLEKCDENNTTVCINTENDIIVKKDSIKIQKKKEKKKKKNNYEKVYNNKNDRNINNEISNSNKHEFITFLSKIKIYINNYKKNKRMISIHIYDVLMYIFNDDQISKFVLNLKKFNVLNCLSYIDNSNNNRYDSNTCENNLDVKNEQNSNNNRYFNNEKYCSTNSINGFENKYQQNKTNKIDSKLYDKKNSNYNGIYLYNSILKLAKNGNFIFSYDYKNTQINKFNKSLTNIDTYSVNDKNVISDNEIENEESNKKINGYQELYNSISINISENPQKIHFDNINKRFNKKSIDFIHTNYYNNLNADYFTFNGPDKKEVNHDDTLEICPSSIDAGISSVEIGIIPVDPQNKSIEATNDNINTPNIATEISNNIIENGKTNIVDVANCGENGKTNIDDLTNFVENVNTNNDINNKNEICSLECIEDINLVGNSNEVSYFTDENDKFLSIQNTQNSSEITGELNERSDEIQNCQNGGENNGLDAGENSGLDAGENSGLDAGENSGLDAGENNKVDPIENIKADASGSNKVDAQKKEESMILEKKRKSELDVSTFRNLKKGKYLDNNENDFNKYNSLEIKENDKIDQVEKNRDSAPEGVENGAEDNGLNLEIGALSIDESVSIHGYSNGENFENNYGNEEYEEIEIIKHKENDDIKNIAFHLVNFEVIIDYTYFINVYKWFTKLNLKYEKIKKISDFAAYSHNSINEKSDENTPKYNYTLFLQNNKIYIPIYKLSIYEYTFYENAKNNLYTSFLPTIQFHFSCSYKSINVFAHSSARKTRKT
ncbi:hypothetical protein [Plasmodium yoelii yoelii]|uniref:Uncharacterized protein n=1 Tax=Plasmodium yoelii yoelii TaxID=73239 RepID=Q7RFA6_PLAYO|nr:hypothetical protein [Plasmodium yoelii yoelii]